MSKLNAGQVTRRVKKELSLAKLPAYRVSTRYTKLSERSPAGSMFGWQSFVHGLDDESIEVVELIMGNLSGLIDVTRHGSFLSIVLEDQ